jgi:predicted ATP-dependent endonuclease of OLD family
MIEKIKLENFRCFENSIMSIRDLSIIVGKNNSGKSTIIEALRMISMVTKKCIKTNYINAPKSLSLPLTVKGFRLPVERLKIDLRGVVYYYKSDVAKITAYFKNKTKIVVYINKEVAFATIIDKSSNLITSKTKAEALNIISISILPQIGLIKETEKRLSDTTIIEDMDTYLSSRHFRNEMLLHKSEFFSEFKRLAEETWPGLRVMNLEYDYNHSENINLFIEDARFPAEIGLMGSGIQMWLQIIWFICKSKGSEVIILDEPDVYMHPDLQLKILNLVKSLFNQVIIATHSIEIITNVSPRNIVTIDKRDRQMRYANHLAAVQNIVDDIGSVYNLSLTKLNNSNKCFFVEGEDIKILQQFYNVLHAETIYSLDTIPSLPLGGFKRINEAFGAAKLLYENTGGHFKCYAILDSDYYTKSQIDEQEKKAIDNHLLLHIWSKKELENYIMKPAVLFRILFKTDEKYFDFIEKYEKLIDTFKDVVIDSYTTKIQEEDRKLAAGTAALRAREYVNSKWTNLEEKLNIVPGKDLLRATNGWMKENYNTSCSMKSIFNVMKADDIDIEVVEILNQLTN